MRDTVGGLVGKASQKMTHAFPDLLVQFPLVSSSLIRNVGVIRENVIGGLFITGKQSIPRWTQTNILHRAYAVPAGKLRRVINDTSVWIHASLTHNHSEIRSHTCSIANTRTQKLLQGKLCPINCCNHYSTYAANLSPAISITVWWWSTERDRTKPRRSHDKPPPNPRSHKHTG